MLQAIPRSILMLIGGVASDRLRPRTVMLLSDLFRAGVVGTIALLVATGRITMPSIYALALLFGIVHAFFSPRVLQWSRSWSTRRCCVKPTPSTR